MASHTEPLAAIAPSEPGEDAEKTERATHSVLKPSDMYREDKGSSLFGSSPTSLNRLMSSRTSLGSVRSALAMDFNRRHQQQKKDLSVDAYGYGYGFGADEDEKNKPSSDESHIQKRRRFQRRNSKTPAMLMAMNSPLLLHLDFLEDKKEHTNSSAAATGTKATCTSASTAAFDAKKIMDSWDSGLEIAEELVMQIQKRRKSNS